MRYATENPLSMSKPEQIAIGVGLVAGLGAAIYYWTRPAAAAPSPTMPTLVLTPGAQSSTLTGAGLVITLPPGAVWAAGGQVAPQLVNTSKTIIIPTQTPAQIAAMTSQPGSLTLNWTDSNGTAQTTTLTLSY